MSTRRKIELILAGGVVAYALSGLVVDVVSKRRVLK